MSDDQGLSVRLFEDAGTLTAHVVGELDMLSAEVLRKELVLPARLVRLHLDLSALVFVDVQGMAAVDAVTREAEARGGVVTASGASSTQERLFHLYGLGRLLLTGGGNGP